MDKRELNGFKTYLVTEDRSEGTVEKYLRDVGAFFAWLGDAELTQEAANEWKEHLLNDHAPVTVNAMLASLNSYCRFAGIAVRVKFVKIQRRLFREQSRELTRAEFDRLLAVAQRSGKERLALLMEAIGASGIRVSEVKYITQL